MVNIQEGKDIYLGEFESLAAHAKDEPAWLQTIRQTAMASFSELGFPTTRHEDWRFTNVSAIAQCPFETPSMPLPEIGTQDIADYVFEDLTGPRIVMVNGQLCPELSALNDIQDGVTIGCLSDLLKLQPAWLEAHLARHADYQQQAFVALNSALMRDGVVIHVPKGIVVEAPIQILYITATQGRALMVHPRNLIIAEEHSELRVIESYASVDDHRYLTNVVTEIVAGDSAIIDHNRIQRESDEAFHVARYNLHQGRSSRISSNVAVFGAALTRGEIEAKLDGPGADCTLNGLSVLAGQQHVDHHLKIDHAKPHCDSWEYFKGIYDDSARGVFSGRIIVQEGAQKTDAKQTNMSLLLSDQALADSKPQLEIFADDVKCTHGATIGQIDADAIFYLRSRGLSLDAAKSMMIFAFAGEVVAEFRQQAVRDKLNELLLDRLPQGELLRERL